MAEIIAELISKDCIAGIHEISSVKVPVGATMVRARIDRRDMDLSLTVLWGLELSLDGGKTWISHGGASAVGKPFYDPDTMKSATESWFETSLPEPKNPNRMLRGKMDLSKNSKLGLIIEVR